MVKGQEISPASYLDCVRAISHLETILKKWKGSSSSLSALRNLKVLDLASGSSNTRTPYFSRICADNGAEVVAIDINPQGEEDKTKFTCIQADLVDVVMNQGLQHIPSLQGTKFDMIHSSDFIGNYDSGLIFQLIAKRIAMGEFKQNLFKQAGELLAEGGVMTLNMEDPTLYIKRLNNIVPLD